MSTLSISQNARARVRSALALVASTAIVATILSSPFAARADDSVVLTPVAPSAGSTVSGARLPLVDSEAGFGAALKAGVESSVPLGSAARGATGALVRVSAFNARTDLTISGAAAIAISVAATRSASATLLLPVDANGSVTLTASDAVDVRIELLAAFTGAANAPGSTFALPAAVMRADTVNQLAGDALTSEPLSLGVVGVGGVPAEGVRAAHITAAVVLRDAGRVTIADQVLELPAGESVVTTIVAPNADGAIDVKAAGTAGHLQVFVRGYTIEASANSAAVNLTSSFVIDDKASPETVKTTAKTPAAVEFGSLDDAAYTLALVSATPSSRTTTLDISASSKGRASGLIVDDTEGALPQLALVKAGEAKAHLRTGSSEVTLTRIGDLLGKDAAVSSGAAVTITTPAAGEAIDLTEKATFTLSGALKSGSASIGSVHVYSGSTRVGSPAVRTVDGKTSFSLELAAPETGDYDFRVVSTDRSGKETSASVSVGITLPPRDVVLLNADTVVLDDALADSVVRVIDTSILFSMEPTFKPGDVIVSDATDGAPQGFLRRVVSIDLTADGWLVATAVAALTEAISQADVDEELAILNSGTPTFSDAAPQPGDTPNVDIIDDGEEVVSFYRHPGVRAFGFGIGGAVRSAIDLESSLSHYFVVKSSFAVNAEKKTTDTSAASPENKEKVRQSIKASATGGATLDAEIKVGFELKFELKIAVGWNWGPTVEVKKFSTVLTRSAESTLHGNVTLTGDFEYKRTLKEIQLKPITFSIGPVPVVITSEFVLGVEATIAAEASSDVKWNSKIVQDYGFGYENGRWKDLSTEPALSNTDPIFKDLAAGTLAASTGLTAELDVSIYDAAGPVLAAGGRIGLDAAADLTKVNVEIYLTAKIGVSVKLKVPIIDKEILSAVVVPDKTKKWILHKSEILLKDADEEPTPPDGDGDGDGDGDVTDPNMPRPNPAPEFADSDLRVTLYWNNKNDLDLHVFEPSGEEISYEYPFGSDSGGLLDIDSIQGCSDDRVGEPGGVENIYWPNGTAAPAGTYTITVNQYDACGLDYGSWVIEVWSGDRLVTKQSGNTDRTFSISHG